jgi:hypothetical protein
MSSPRLLDGPIIRELLAEVAAALPSSSTQHIVIVAGGSLLAWMGLRDATEDVDSIQRLDAELRDAVASIATRHGLDTDWLNDRAAPFMPATFDVGRCTVLLEQPRLLALGASLRDVFLMKLYRTQPNDVADMRTIWPHIASEFRTGAEVASVLRSVPPCARRRVPRLVHQHGHRRSGWRRVTRAREPVARSRESMTERRSAAQNLSPDHRVPSARSRSPSGSPMPAIVRPGTTVVFQANRCGSPLIGGR